MEIKNLKPWMRDGIIGFFAGSSLYILRLAGILVPYLSDWNAENVSLGTVGITMIIAYTIAGMFIGELIYLSTGKKKSK